MQSPILDLDLTNAAGRLLLTSDVHGAYDTFEAVLRKMDYDADVDTVLIAGDLVDRGPDSPRCLEWIGTRRHALQGNHERFLQLVDDGRMDRADHIEDGGSWYHDLTLQERHRYRSVLTNLPLAARIRTRGGRHIGVVHADAAGNDFGFFCSHLMRDDPNAASIATLGRRRYHEVLAGRTVPPFRDMDHVFFGHTPVPEILTHANFTWIDTGLPHGRSTVIDVDQWLDGRRPQPER